MSGNQAVLMLANKKFEAKSWKRSGCMMSYKLDCCVLEGLEIIVREGEMKPDAERVFMTEWSECMSERTQTSAVKTL